MPNKRLKKKSPNANHENDPEDTLNTRKYKSTSDSIQARKRVLYEDARMTIKNLVATSNQLLEQTKTQILEMKSQEVQQDGILENYHQWNSVLEDAYIQWQRSNDNFLTKLGQERSSAVDNASKKLNQAAHERSVSMNKVLRQAKLQVEQRRQQEKLATDASAFIKHYKDLLTKSG